MRKIAHKIMLAMIICCIGIVGLISTIMLLRFMEQIEKSGDALVMSEAQENGGTLAKMFQEVTVNVEGVSRLATAFDVDAYSKGGTEYFETAAAPWLSGYLERTVDTSKLLHGAYFSLAPTLVPSFAERTTVDEVYFTYIDGALVRDTPPTTDIYIPDDPDMTWYYVPMNTGAPYWSEPYTDGIDMVSYVVPLDSHGTRIGVAGVDVSLDDMSKLAQSIQVYDTGFALLQDNYNNFFDYNGHMDQFDQAQIDTLAETHNPSDVLRMNIGGVPNIVGHATLANGYRLYIFAPVGEVMAEGYALLTGMLVIIGLSIFVLLVVSFLVGRSISRPIVTVTKNLQSLAEGDYSFTVAPDVLARSDETGQLGQATASVLSRLQYITQTLNVIASGDLRADVKIAFEGDEIGTALTSSLENLNRMFSHIQMSSDQLNVGSEQVATESQSLARGCIDQARAVSVMREKMGTLQTKNLESANFLQQAMKIGADIKIDADTGALQMSQLSKAVLEINDASAGINQVLTEIDNIAFQTNILALNASVEAARAGQHGKGFAVVAEEVRNLAARSAHAAKQSSELIGLSNDKAAAGSVLTKITAVTFAKIIEDIGRNSVILSDIKSSSNQQNEYIDEMDQAVNQVSDIVNSTAAASEESAAAAEEMSAQASAMLETVSHFQYKKHNMAPYTLDK